MAINDSEHRIDPHARRVRLTGVDTRVLCNDGAISGGKAFQSTTYKTVIPAEPHVLTEARVGSIETMIAINVEPCDSAVTDLNGAPVYESSVQYFNRSNRIIRVTDKHNITVTLAKLRVWSSQGNEHFIIRRVHRFNNSEAALSILVNHVEDQRYLSVDNRERTQILAKIDEENRKGSFRNPNALIEVRIDRIIPITLLYEYASIYVSDVDLLFRLEGVEIGTPHPTSQDAVLKGDVLKILGNRRLTGALYEIVDTENSYSSRYVCLGKEVAQIPINRDPRRESGIYYTTFDSINTHDLRVTLNHCGLNKAEELGIFQTREEAETKGHVNDHHRIELANLQRLLATSETEATAAKQQRQAALDQLQHERSVEKIAMERDASQRVHLNLLKEIDAKLEKLRETDKLESGAQARKDQFEARSTIRKDTSEMFKWVPTVVNGLIACVVLGIAVGSGNAAGKKK